MLVFNSVKAVLFDGLPTCVWNLSFFFLKKGISGAIALYSVFGFNPIRGKLTL